MDRMIYMDHAATTPVRQEVLSAMLPYFTLPYGNPSSLHDAGQKAKTSLENARRLLAAVLHAQKEEIVFTSGGTESDNWAILKTARSMKERGSHIITSSVEHPAVLKCCEMLQKEGFFVTFLPVDKNGCIRITDLEAAITDKTVLVSLMTANNETGTVFPIEEAGKICRERGILFHTDAVQAFGKIPLDVRKMNVDLLSVSAHKFFGPKGVGLLYVRKDIMIPSWNLGGGQERGLRSGTENLAGIMGMAKAAELAADELEKNADHLQKMQQMLEMRMMTEIPGACLNAAAPRRIPGVSSIRFDHVSGESLMMLLDMAGIMVSTASACSQGKTRGSHVLSAMGLSDDQAAASLRISLGPENTEEEVDLLVTETLKAVQKLRALI